MTRWRYQHCLCSSVAMATLCSDWAMMNMRRWVRPARTGRMIMHTRAHSIHSHTATQLIATALVLLQLSVCCAASVVGAGTSRSSLALARRLLLSSSHRGLIEEGQTVSVQQQYPFAAMVLRPGDTRYLCTGTLIHPRVVLTAAHCVVPALDGQPNPVVHLGREGSAQSSGYEQYTTRSFVHPRFRVGSFDFDFAALLLDRPATAQPARLVPIGAVLGLPAADSKSLAPYHTWRQLPQPAQAAPAAAAAQLESLQLTALGWGATTTGSSLPLQLQSGRVSPVAMDKCQRLFDPFGSKITPRMVCVTGRTCAGDSGGPLLLQDSQGQYVLVGQVSFGFPRKSGQQGCPSPNPVTAFTDLSAPRIRDWLQQAVLSQADSMATWSPPSPQGALDTLAQAASAFFLGAGAAGSGDSSGAAGGGGSGGSNQQDTTYQLTDVSAYDDNVISG